MKKYRNKFKKHVDQSPYFKHLLECISTHIKDITSIYIYNEQLKKHMKILV